VGIVTVVRSSNTSHGTYAWTVTFESLPGTLELLTPYPGRLTPLANNVALHVVKKQAGSPAQLVYDGTTAPEVRSYTVSNLRSDMTYAFKVPHPSHRSYDVTALMTLTSSLYCG
jgi:hypothetical protein